MDYLKNEKKVAIELYNFMCKHENQTPVSFGFCKMKASGSCTYSTKVGIKKPIAITLNIETGSFGAAWVLIHEFAHKVCIRKYNDATHGSKFKSELKRLESIYLDCEIANKFIF